MVIPLQTYLELLSNPSSARKKHVPELKELTEKYPYFQSSRALYLKALKNAESFRYNHELKITAAHTSDRSVLFDFISSQEFDQKLKVASNDLSVSSDSEFKNLLEQHIDLELGKPISFSKSEKHSFNEWLQLSSFKPVQRVQKEKFVENQTTIIDKFIQSNPKIIPVDKHQEVGLSVKKNKSDQSLMTETLARVYLEQKKYTKAIKAYEILSLKYPEKSGFFADQIKRIKILKQKKT